MPLSSSLGTSVDGGGSAGALGPYADVAALQAAKPAAASPGAAAYVGSTAPYALYDSTGGAWIPRNTQVRSSVGVHKLFGSQSSVQEGVFGGSFWAKMELEAHVKRVRLVIMSREHDVSSGWKFAVAPTDQPANDTIANAYYPQKAGVTKNTLAQNKNEFGWRVGTWVGRASPISAPPTPSSSARRRAAPCTAVRRCVRPTTPTPPTMLSPA